jgi:hypothetical protein
LTVRQTDSLSEDHFVSKTGRLRVGGIQFNLNPALSLIPGIAVQVVCCSFAIVAAETSDASTPGVAARIIQEKRIANGDGQTNDDAFSSIQTAAPHPANRDAGKSGFDDIARQAIPHPGRGEGLVVEAQNSPEPLAGNRTDFEVGGKKAFVITAGSNAGSNWVWYAPTLGTYPNSRLNWLFNRLLKSGISIAGIDVGESFGNLAGRTAFGDFHAHMTATRHMGQPCLLAQSRGALMLFNWATDNPEKVRCIAAIYPVLDAQSWPGLESKGLQAAYGEKDAQGVRDQLPVMNPIDRVPALARARIPVFLIHGTEDRMVPADRNSVAYSKRYAELGGVPQLVLVPGKGHEEAAEFFESPELVSFLLRQLR